MLLGPGNWPRIVALSLIGVFSLCFVRHGQCDIIPVLHAEVALNSSPYVVRVEGRYAVVGASRGIEVFDIARPSAPTRVSSFPLPRPCWHLCVSGNYAFAAYTADVNGSEIVSIDLSTPETPRIASILRLPAFVSDLAFGSSTLAAACGSSGLFLISTSNPENLQLSGEYRQDGFAPVSVALSAERAFTGSRGFQVFDISDRSAPRQLASWVDPSPMEAGPIAVEGAILYLATADSGLRIFNLANADATDEPELLSTVTPAQMGASGVQLFSLTVSRGIAYVGSALTTLVAIDARDPARPRRIGMRSFASYVSQNAIQYPYAYLPHRPRPTGPPKLLVVDVGKISACDRITFQPIEAQQYPFDPYWSITASQDSVFIGLGRNGIRQMRLNSDDVLEQVAESSAYASHLAIEGDRLYHWISYGGIEVRDRSNLQSIGSWRPPEIAIGGPDEFYAAGVVSYFVLRSFAYVKYSVYRYTWDEVYFEGVRTVIVDYRNPAAAQQLRDFEPFGDYGSFGPFRTNSDYGYVATGDGIDIFDLRLEPPGKVGRYDGACRGLDISRGFAFVATGTSRIDIFDLNESPTELTAIASLPTIGQTSWIITDSQFACVRGEVIDIRVPRTPRSLGVGEPLYANSGVFGPGGNVYVLYSSGIEVVRLNQLPYPRLEVLPPAAGLFRFRAALLNNTASHVQRALNGGLFTDWQPVEGGDAVIDFAVPQSDADFAIFRFSPQ